MDVFNIEQTKRSGLVSSRYVNTTIDDIKRFSKKAFLAATDINQTHARN